ncbi:MAG: hypothetical protein A3F42_03660 [Gammaproteobacteria bacterium RIFCSPHIGHO2_12_FULL_37_34]|nr:MAG: hypothetical protein A3F42_03660 [Gammaproteobacteria bacterium RIFCSPHIGHO2_12_FULL_37_34]
MFNIASKFSSKHAKAAHFSLIASNFYSHHEKMYNIKQPNILYNIFHAERFYNRDKQKVKGVLKEILSQARIYFARSDINIFRIVITDQLHSKEIVQHLQWLV